MSRWLERAILAVLMITAVSLVAMSAEEAKKAGKEKQRGDNIYDQVELFANVMGMVRSNYVEKVDAKKLIYGALDGMLSSLDDYSQFMDSDEFRQMQIETKGEFGGIGIEVALKDGIVTVVSPISGTPAETAGIKPGDKIVRIDGQTTKNMSLSEAVNKMRGKPSSGIMLTVWREKDEKVLEFKLKRAVVKVESIKKARIIEDKIGYIRIAEFQENTPRDLDNALKRMESQGMDSLILDVRNNPGGLLDQAVLVSERFLPKDSAIVSIKSRFPEQNMTIKSSGRFAKSAFPLVVLVNEGSASGSEILAGAIKDNKRGIIAGTRTFGKASVQAVVPLSDGSAVRFTTAWYYTPSGKLIKKEGIIPDVVIDYVELAAGKKEAEDIVDVFEKAGEKSKDGSGSKDSVGAGTEKDNQLAGAVNIIKVLKIEQGKR